MHVLKLLTLLSFLHLFISSNPSPTHVCFLARIGGEYFSYTSYSGSSVRSNASNSETKLLTES